MIKMILKNHEITLPENHTQKKNSRIFDLKTCRFSELVTIECNLFHDLGLDT